MAKGKLFALIVVVGAVGVVAATGAFTTVTAERTATINVSGDDAALLQMDPADDTDVVSMNENTGTIQIDISEDGGVGLNPVATTSFDPALNVTNQGSQDVGFSVDVSVSADQVDASEVDGYDGDDEQLATDLANSVVIEAYNLEEGVVGNDEAELAQLTGAGEFVSIDGDGDTPTNATVRLNSGEGATIAVAFDLTDNNGGEIPELDSEDIEIAIEFTADADTLNDN